jgi:GNAT superfamily N-acetyltransferase
MPLDSPAKTDSIEIAARRHFFAAAPDQFGCTIINLPHTQATLLSVLALPSPTMNRVIGLPGDQPLPDATLAQIKQIYRQRSIPRFWIHAWNTPGSAALHDSLMAHGCTPQGAWAKLECALDATAPERTAISPFSMRLAMREEYRVAGEILSSSFNMPLLEPWMAGLAGRPGWQVFFACDDDGMPVATGSLLIDGNRAWFGMGGTLPIARGHGAQQDLLAARLAAAAAAGCVTVNVEVEAPPPGEVRSSLNNILRAGFHQIGTRQNYLCES